MYGCGDTGFTSPEVVGLRLAPSSPAAHVMYFKKPKISELDKASAAAAPARRAGIDASQSIAGRLESGLHVYGVKAAEFKHATKLSPLAQFPLPSELLSLASVQLGSMPVLCRRLGEREGETGRESNRRRKDETKSDCCLPDVKACVCAEDRRC